VQFTTRLHRMRALIGYGAADEALVLATRDIVAPYASSLIERVYDRLLAEPETASYFAGADGLPDEPHRAARAGSLQAWLITAISAPLDDAQAAALAATARAHTRRGGAAAVSIKGRYLLVMSAILQDEMTTLLVSLLKGDAPLVPTIAAWNKLVLLHLDVFLAVYAGTEGNPHWY
jgi:hypothetical protein